MAAALTSALARDFAGIDNAVVVTDTTGRIVVTSPGFERAVGRVAAASLGQELPELLRWEPGPTVAGAVLQATLHPDGAPPVAVQVRLAAIPATVASANAPYRMATFKVPSQLRMAVAGQLEIALDRARDAAGKKWMEVRERVLKAAEQLLAARLDPDDIVRRAGDGFVIGFAHLDEAGASLAAQRIAEDLDGLLARDPDATAATATSFVAAIPADIGQDIAGMQDQLARARSDAASRARELLSAATGTAHLDLDPAFNVSGRRAELTFARLRDGLGGKLDRLAWSCTGQQDGDVAADYAMLGIGTALAALATGKAPGGLLVVSVSVHALLNARAADRLGRLLGGTPKGLRDRLAIELTGLRTDLPVDQVADLVRLLSGLCKGAGARLPDPGMHDLVHGVIRDMPVITLHTDALASPQLPRLVTLLSAAGVLLVVRHVDSEDALMELYQSGISRMTGTALAGGDPAH